MTIKMTPPKTAHHMVNYMHGSTGNMQEVSRRTGVPVNLLWTARGKSSYVFKTPYYTNGLKQAYMIERGFEEFPDYIEDHLSALRSAYELANAGDQTADKQPLKQLLKSLWPIVDHNRGDFSKAPHKVAFHYLSGTMMLVADLQNYNEDTFPQDKIQRAIDDFTAASDPQSNRALRHRALLSLSSARQRKSFKDGHGFAPLSDLLDRNQLSFLLSVQLQQTDNSVTDALNAIKLASAMKKREPMLEAEKNLLLQDKRFSDPDFPGWSPISPVCDDPDLAFYRATKCH